MKTSELLGESLALLDGGNKWIKGSYRSGDRYCALGAVRVASAVIPDWDDRVTSRTVAFDALERGLPDGARYDGCDPTYLIFGFNDDPDTEWPDVEAAFVKAIALAKENE